VDSQDIPANVITMRSTVRLKDLVTGDENTYSLGFPTEADKLLIAQRSVDKKLPSSKSNCPKILI